MAQRSLSFEQALERTLQHNFDIRMAGIDLEKAVNDASLANSGYLPTVTGSGGYNWTYYQGQNRLIIGDVDYDANSSFNYNATLALNYTIFEGQGRRYRFLQLKEAQALTELQVRQIVETTILELSRVYYEVSRLDEAVASLRSSMDISRDRSLRATYGLEYGQRTQLEVLNAKVDLNNDSIALVNALQLSDNTRRNLNLIMGEELEAAFAVDGQVAIRNDIQQDEAVAAALEHNVRIGAAQHQLRNAELAIGTSKAAWLPTLGASAGYNYRGSDDPNGAFVLGSSSIGPNAGLNLNWTLFDGRNSTRSQNARLDHERSLLEQTSTERTVELDVLNAHGIYRNTLFVLEAQEDMVATAQSNFERSEEAYRLGQITSVEFRQAQLNLLNAELQRSQARYDAKNAELQVLSLMGVLTVP